MRSLYKVIILILVIYGLGTFSLNIVNSRLDGRITLDGNYEISPIPECDDDKLTIYYGVKYKPPLISVEVGNSWQNVPEVNNDETYFKIVCNKDNNLYYWGYNFPPPMEGMKVIVER